MTQRLRRLDQAAAERPWATVRYLRRLVFERRIPHYKLGSGRNARVLIDLDDLDALVASGRVDEAPTC